MPRQAAYFVIFNPAAGHGRAGRLVDEYASRLRERLGAFDHATTSAPGDEVRLADRALDAGCTAIIAVGGDGTWSKVADRIVRSGRRDVALGLLPAGTGNDFAKSLGIRADRIENILGGIVEGRRRTIDVGRAASRFFLNVVGFGFDIAVIDDAAGFPFLRGDLLYRFCALRQLFKFRGLPIRVSDDFRRGGEAGPPDAHGFQRQLLRRLLPYRAGGEPGRRETRRRFDLRRRPRETSRPVLQSDQGIPPRAQ
jgi:diacylglycerol kinase (ATP)